MRRWLLLALVIVGCDTSEPAPKAAKSALAQQVAAQLPGRPAVRVFEASGSAALVGVPGSVRADSDQPPLYALHRYERSTGSVSDLGLVARSAQGSGASLLVVTEAGDLERVGAAGRVRLASDVLGQPALLPDGRIVIAKRAEEPGESDLQILVDGMWLPVAPAPGPDDFPVALPDGRIAFVSGRTGLASLWVADLQTGQALQLTNVGRTRVDEAFVPPPVRDVRVDDTSLSYDAGDGQRWSVDHQTGVANRQDAP